MAGDWIKLEHATAQKPEILLAAELLGVKRREALGLFVDYFLWLDDHMDETCNGFVTHVSRRSVEEALQCIGFAAVLEQIGWATFDDEARTLFVINSTRHNGKTAKSRALVNKRVKRFRNADCNASVTPNSYQRREEKRIKPNTFVQQETLNGFDQFWKAYPKKQGKESAKKSWAKLNPDADLQAKILAAVAVRSKSTDWLKDEGQFIPLPASFLNGRRYDDEMAAAKPRGVAL